MTSDNDHSTEVHILETLRTHDQRELALLDSYRRLAEQSPDAGIRYLAQLIIDDEERHHQVIGEMVNRIASWVEGIELAPGTPALEPRVDPELLEATHQLI